MKDAVDLAAKVGAVVALASYVIGLLVVNTYLYTLHVSLADPAVFKVRFVYSGAVTLALLCLACLPPAWAYGYWGHTAWRERQGRAPSATPNHRRGMPRSQARPSLTPLLVAWAIAVLLPGLVVAKVIRRTPGGISSSDVLGETIAVLVFALLTGISLFLANQVARGQMGGGDKLPRWMGVIAFTTFGTVMLLVYVSLVGRWLYPAFPGQFGGGSPQKVCLVFDPQSAAQVEALGLTRAGSNSAAASVLFDGTDFLVIRRNDRTVVEFDKRLLVGTTHARAGRKRTCASAH